jgi:alkaline phosphatase D
VHAKPQGLDANRWYWYRFTALGQRSVVGRTRTAPASSDRSKLVMAVASCQRFDAAPFAAWRHLSEQPLDAVMFLGDYIYEGGSSPDAWRPHVGGTCRTLDQYRARYAQYKSDRELQAAHAACPWWIVWDDHEVANDYAGDDVASGDRQFMLRRAAAYQAYWEHMPFTMAQRPTRGDMRIHDRFTWGRLATVHLLDDRQYRDPHACPYVGRDHSRNVKRSECAALMDPARSLLGAAQERWLTQGLDTVRPWNLIGQQTLMARFAWSDPAHDPSYWNDGWDGYPASRQRLLDAVAERELRGAVVLSGDVHTHYVASLKKDFDQPKSAVVASEFCGTSITSRSISQARIDAALRHNPHVHLGRGDKRGAIVLDITDRRLMAHLLAVDDERRVDSPVSTVASFVVEAGRPGTGLVPGLGGATWAQVVSIATPCRPSSPSPPRSLLSSFAAGLRRARASCRPRRSRGSMPSFCILRCPACCSGLA